MTADEKDLKPVFLRLAFVMLMFVVVNQSYIQRSLSKINEETSLLNQVGKQRTRSNLLLVERERDQANFSALQQALEDMKRTHRSLTIPGNTGYDPEVAKILNDVSLEIEQMELISYERNRPEAYETQLVDKIIIANDLAAEILIKKHNRRIQVVRWITLALALLSISAFLVKVFVFYMPGLKKMNSAKIKAVEQSERLDATIRLVKTMAHDLKTPLQAFRAKLDVIELRHKDGLKVHEQELKQIKSSSIKVERHINNLLASK